MSQHETAEAGWPQKAACGNARVLVMYPTCDTEVLVYAIPECKQ